MLFMQSLKIQRLIKLINSLLSIKDKELFTLIKQEISISAIDSTWLIAKEKVMTFITVFSQEDNLAGDKWKSFANL